MSLLLFLVIAVRYNLVLISFLISVCFRIHQLICSSNCYLSSKITKKMESPVTGPCKTVTSSWLIEKKVFGPFSIEAFLFS